jgi:hypothetical protein
MLVRAWLTDDFVLLLRLFLPLCWGGWLLSVGCVRLHAAAHQGGVWVQLPCFFGPGAGHLLKWGCVASR